MTPERRHPAKDAEWYAALARTKGHDLDSIDVRWQDDRPWLYVTCDCGREFTERDEYALHITRLVVFGHDLE